MGDINGAIEKLHAARQLIDAAEYAIKRAHSQIATTEVGDRLDDELAEIRQLGQLCKETGKMIEDALGEKLEERAHHQFQELR